jgi:hypothetical protein
MLSVGTAFDLEKDIKIVFFFFLNKNSCVRKLKGCSSTAVVVVVEVE